MPTPLSTAQIVYYPTLQQQLLQQQQFYGNSNIMPYMVGHTISMVTNNNGFGSNGFSSPSVVLQNQQLSTPISYFDHRQGTTTIYL